MQGNFSEKNKILNFYQLNVLNNVAFMHKITIKTASSMLHPWFQRPSHSYPTNFSEFNYSSPARNIKKLSLEYQ